MDSPTLIEDHIRCTFVSLGCNREPSAIDWNQQLNLITYAGSSLVAVYNPHPSINSLLGTLRGHSKDVTVTQWLPQDSIASYNNFISSSDGSNAVHNPVTGQIVSAGFDGRVLIWDIYDKSNPNSNDSNESHATPVCKLNQTNFGYRLQTELKPPSGEEVESITNLAVLYTHETTVLVVLLANGDVRIYTKRDVSQQWQHVQTIPYPPHHLMQSAALTTFTLYNGQTCVLLALAGVDGTVHIHASVDLTADVVYGSHSQQASTPDNQQTACSDSSRTVEPLFFVLGTLAGHRDWVRALDFIKVEPQTRVQCTTGDEGMENTPTYDVLLASGSQDKTSRIWRFSIPGLDVLHLLSQQETEHQEADGVSSPEPSAADVNPTSSEMNTSVPSDTMHNGNEEQQSSTPGNTTLDKSLIASSSLGENGQLFYLSSSYVTTIAVTLETVLIGHEAWVIGVQWKRSSTDPTHIYPESALTLLTVGTDHSLSEWSPRVQRGQSSMWNCSNRIGDGNAYLCYYGGCYGPNGLAIIAVTFNGALSLWYSIDSPYRSTHPHLFQQEVGDQRQWVPAYCPTGHQNSVVDVICCHGDDPSTLDLMSGFLAETTTSDTRQPPLQNKNPIKCTSSQYIGPQLPYIITTSMDQTCRVFSPLFVSKSGDATAAASASTPSVDNEKTIVEGSPQPSMTTQPWYEIARSQIHGWDMVALAAMRAAGQYHQYISCAEEKVIRVLRSPSLFIASLYKLASDVTWSREQLTQLLQLATYGAKPASQVDQQTDDHILASSYHHNTRPLCAVQSKLGLSNKPIMEGDDVTTQTELQSVFDQDSVIETMNIDRSLTELQSTPPVEEYLATRTLWSEIEKLYGHGYDLASITSGNITPMILSSSSARSAKNAVIRLWNAHTLKEEQLLYAHQSTVVQMAVSVGNAVARDYNVRRLLLQHKLASPEISDEDKTVLLGELDHSQLLSYSQQSNDISCDRLIATVSRDMQLALFRRNVSDEDAQQHHNNGTIPPYVLCSLVKAHARQLFAVTFCGSDNIIATAARDKLVKIWKVENKNTLPKLAPMQTIKLPKPSLVPTALASTQVVINSVVYVLLIVGCEDGTLLVYGLSIADDASQLSALSCLASKGEDLPTTAEFTFLGTVNPLSTHSMAVNKIVVFPKVADEKTTLITVSNDHSTRMWLLDF